ncbi:hypothetical protein OVY29_22780 [Sphingopyxis sp. SE2]|uniref:hypothetical protein n=1 Tax=Sphingopyxis sp. SE2 TaxID=1586240 RepID=UPI0028BF7583|nr:hypothetical protein [Sphingopyxis sp. SE2]MDT7531486.1 hypothetical protein [Sphingopyxis sp. SE2]
MSAASHRRPLPDAIRLARSTRKTIVINIAIAVGLKLVFLVLAVFGLTNLWTAIIADTAPLYS